MSVASFKESVPEGFDNPIALPRTLEQEREWQAENRAWWESHPMRYDFSDRVAAEEFTPEFYEEIDRRFFSDARAFMPWKRIPFDPLIDFESLRDCDVLEIGVGNGSHAQLISAAARSFTGIDLTNYGVQSTTRRLKQAGLNGSRVQVMQMDAEKMDFPDECFDFVWSWGVIHHSANTRKIIEETYRVLKPGGKAITMVYHRNFWNYYIVAGLCGGIFQGRLLRTLSIHQARQLMIDGAIARYYSIAEWKALVRDLFSIEDVRVYGSKSELIPLPNGRMKAALKSVVPDVLSRFLTNRCRMGMFLVSTLRKQTAKR